MFKFEQALINSGKAAKDLPTTLAAIRKELQDMLDAAKPTTILDDIFKLTKRAAQEASDAIFSAQANLASLEMQLTDTAAAVDRLRKDQERDRRSSNPGSQRKYRRDGPRAAGSELAELEATLLRLPGTIETAEGELKKVEKTAADQGSIFENLDQVYQSVVGRIKEGNDRIREGTLMQTAGVSEADKRVNIEGKLLVQTNKALIATANREAVEESINKLRNSGIDISEDLNNVLDIMLQTAEQREASETNALDILMQKSDLELKMLDLLKEQQTLKADQAVAQGQAFLNDLLTREVALREKNLALQMDLAKEEVRLRAREAKIKNPLFDDQQFIAKEELRLAKEVRDQQLPIIEAERTAKRAGVEAEFKMLEMKRKGLEIQMKTLAIQMKAEDREDLAKEATAMADQLAKSKGALAPLKDAALELVDMEATAKRVRLDNAVRDAKILVEELEPINQVLATGAEAFRDGLGDAVGATFDAITGRISSLKDALAGIAQDVLQQIQDSFIEQMLVRPITEKLGGQQDVDPVDAAEIIQNKTVEAHKTGSEATKAAIEEGGELAGEKIKEKFEEAADNMSTKLANACKCEAPTAAEKRESSLLPEEPAIELVKEDKTAAQIAAENPLSSESIDSMINDIAGMNTGEGKDAPKRGLFTGLGEKFNKFTADFSAIFDKNSEGGFLEKLGKAFTSGGDLFSGLFNNLGSMFSGLF